MQIIEIRESFYSDVKTSKIEKLNSDAVRRMEGR